MRTRNASKSPEEPTGSFVVTGACNGCRATSCVEACPVEAFRAGPTMLVIDPDECIDCTLCEPACPSEAIMTAEDIPESQRHWIGRNATLSKKWPPIGKREAPAKGKCSEGLAPGGSLS